MAAISDVMVMGVRKETDSLGEVEVPSDKLWGAQTQRSLARTACNLDTCSGRQRNTSTSTRRKGQDFGFSFVGLPRDATADSESVEELLEEGNSFEAGVVFGVENSRDPSVSEVTTYEVPEDDVPGEYINQD